MTKVTSVKGLGLFFILMLMLGVAANTVAMGGGRGAMLETPTLTPTPDLHLPPGYRYRLYAGEPPLVELYPPPWGLTRENTQVLRAVQDWAEAENADRHVVGCVITQDPRWYDCTIRLAPAPPPPPPPPVNTRQAGLRP